MRSPPALPERGTYVRITLYMEHYEVLIYLFNTKIIVCNRYSENDLEKNKAMGHHPHSSQTPYNAFEEVAP
jgi:hypothetical protein